jgi:microcystin-dependent protein
MDPFIGEIRLVSFNFAPHTWAFCNGLMMPIAQNTALFSILGTTYGGDGNTTYALPDMRGRAPMHPGLGAGLTNRSLGQTGGDNAAPLDQSNMPAHNHGPMVALNSAATSGTPTAVRSLAVSSNAIYGAPAQLVPMGDTAGGSAPHENRQPYMEMNFIIALQGVFPPLPQP